MIALMAVLLAASPKPAKPTKVPKPEVKVVKEAPAPAAVDPWDFDGLTATVRVQAQPADDLSTMALTQLAVPLEGDAQFKVSAHANTVGGVTITFEDPNDPKTVCALYASKDGDGLAFKDSRCSFFVLSGQARAQATCRKINGTAKRVNDAVAVEATTPDCNAAPMGVPLSVRASVKPVIR